MKKIAFYIILIVFLSACKKNTEDTLQHLSGYWEIESVLLKDGSKKTYNFNETIDYIEITDSFKGFRKKMKPLFNGTYETSKVIEKFQLKIENDSLNIYYKTPYTNWKETILAASKTQLKIINKNNIIYLYKRYIPMTID